MPPALALGCALGCALGRGVRDTSARRRFTAAARDRGAAPSANAAEWPSDATVISLPQAVVLLRSLAAAYVSGHSTRASAAHSGLEDDPTGRLAAFEGAHVMPVLSGSYLAPAALRPLFTVDTLRVLTRCAPSLKYLFLRYSCVDGDSGGTLATDDWLAGLSGDATGPPPSLAWTQLLALLSDFDVVPSILTAGAAAASLSELLHDAAGPAGVARGAVVPNSLSYTGFCEALYLIALQTDPLRPGARARAVHGGSSVAPLGTLAALLLRMDPTRVMFADAVAPPGRGAPRDGVASHGSAVTRLFAALTRGTAVGVTRAGFLAVVRAGGVLSGWVVRRAAAR